VFKRNLPQRARGGNLDPKPGAPDAPSTNRLMPSFAVSDVAERRSSAERGWSSVSLGRRQGAVPFQPFGYRAALRAPPRVEFGHSGVMLRHPEIHAADIVVWKLDVLWAS
jgi:hypothetical protein